MTVCFSLDVNGRFPWTSGGPEADRKGIWGTIGVLAHRAVASGRAGAAAVVIPALQSSEPASGNDPRCDEDLSSAEADFARTTGTGIT